MIGLIILIVYSLYTKIKTPHFKNILVLAIISLISGAISFVFMKEFILWIICINIIIQLIYFTYHHKISWISFILQVCILFVLFMMKNEFVLVLYFISVHRGAQSNPCR